jgi:hypothetical protein
MRRSEPSFRDAGRAWMRSMDQTRSAHKQESRGSNEKKTCGSGPQTHSNHFRQDGKALQQSQQPPANRTSRHGRNTGLKKLLTGQHAPCFFPTASAARLVRPRLPNCFVRQAGTMALRWAALFVLLCMVKCMLGLFCFDLSLVPRDLIHS